jgi:glycerol transport system ATP-binding protein
MGISVEGISKSIQGNPILREVAFEVADGDFATLLGATGAGKTTLLRILAGIERPDTGRVLFDGVDVTAMPVQKRDVAFVYQQFVNYPSLTVFENIASPLRVKRPKLTGPEIESRIHEAAELLGLTEILQHRPEEISGGQQQRTAIARALVKESKYIFLDEPLANLDYKLREELRGELKRIFRDRGGAVVYATPEPIDALSMGSHVGYMQDGALLQFGPTREVYERPSTADVGAFFSHPMMNIVECECVRREGRAFVSVSKELQFPWPDEDAVIPEGGYLLGVRAHALTKAREGERGASFSANVQFAEVVGSDTEIHLEHAGHSMIALVPSIESHRLGETLRMVMDPARCFLFDRNSRALVHEPCPAMAQE